MTAEEVGLTNLGPVPEGMTFLEAIMATRAKRKYTIDPRKRTRTLTICEAQRQVWLIGERLGGADGRALCELAAASFDFGKRMEARMRELREERDRWRQTVISERSDAIYDATNPVWAD